MQINVYDQLAAFYEKIWCNPKMKAQHSALYWFFVNQANRQLWPEWFTVPRDIAMNGAKISKRETYYNAIKVLVEVGLIEYIKSTNQHEAPHFKLICLIRKRNKQGDKQGDKQGSSRGLAGEPYKDVKTIRQEDVKNEEKNTETKITTFEEFERNMIIENERREALRKSNEFTA